jgi:hypothetical protein
VEEGIEMTREQIKTIIDIFEPDTSDLLALDEEAKFYIARRLFNRKQKAEFYKSNDPERFAEIVSVYAL